jgi:RNA polymerase sigma factor (sigma-70 family)
VPDDVASRSADYELLDRWRTGDAAAGQALFARHFDGIYGFFETKCESDADELVQATFLACLRAKAQFRKESSFRTYLFTIARHELYRVLRERQRDGKRLDFELSSIAELASSPITRLGRNQEHQRLVNALRQLPVDQQTLLELHYWEEMGIADLAAVFEAPEVTIRTRLHRARNALRDQMVKMLKADGASLGNALDSLESMDAWAKHASRVAG